MATSLSDVGWPSEPPIPLYGHGGACDRLRQAIATLDGECSVLAKHDSRAAASTAERIRKQVQRIDRVVADLEGRP